MLSGALKKIGRSISGSSNEKHKSDASHAKEKERKQGSADSCKYASSGSIGSQHYYSAGVQSSSNEHVEMRQYESQTPPDKLSEATCTLLNTFKIHCGGSWRPSVSVALTQDLLTGEVMNRLSHYVSPCMHKVQQNGYVHDAINGCIAVVLPVSLAVVTGQRVLFISVSMVWLFATIYYIIRTSGKSSDSIQKNVFPSGNTRVRCVIKQGDKIVRQFCLPSNIPRCQSESYSSTSSRANSQYPLVTDFSSVSKCSKKSTRNDSSCIDNSFSRATGLTSSSANLSTSENIVAGKSSCMNTLPKKDSQSYIDTLSPPKTRNNNMRKLHKVFSKSMGGSKRTSENGGGPFSHGSIRTVIDPNVGHISNRSGSSSVSHKYGTHHSVGNGILSPATPNVAKGMHNLLVYRCLIKS